MPRHAESKLAFVLLTGALGLAWMLWLARLDGTWTKEVGGSVGQAVGTFLAVAAALGISLSDRRRAERAAHQDRVAECKAFIRRRDYEECLRLLSYVESDRRAWDEARDLKARPRSIEATALIRGLWSRRNLWGTAVIWYVESRTPGNILSDDRDAPPEIFAEIEREIVEAVMQLDNRDRHPHPAGTRRKTRRERLADVAERAANSLRRSANRQHEA